MTAKPARIEPRDLSVPRPIDLPAQVPLDGRADLTELDDAKIFAAPEDPADWPAWRETLHRWRASARRRYCMDGAAGPAYTRAGWAAGCYSVCLVWLWDERLYDRATGRFTVAEFLRGGEETYGGFDAVVLWHAYPVIGLDPRNQWDYYRDVPGLAGLVGEFHEHGLRVFVDYNPWDGGTRRTGREDAAEIAMLVADYGVDGVFLDTLKEGARDVIDAVGPDVALEGESRLPLAAVADHALSWAQWFADSAAPGVLRAHWFERRHLMHHTRRWNRDHSAELQSAWVNGCGMLVWDDVFGVWVGWNERDLATLRAMRRLQRAFHRQFAEGEWTPLADHHEDAVAAGVFAHRYDLDGVTVWAVVNRGDTAYRGPVLRTDPVGSWSEQAGGAAVHADERAVSTEVAAGGIACLVRSSVPLATPAAAPLGGDTGFPARTARPVPEPAAVGEPPADAVRIEPGRYVLPVRYRLRETGQHGETRWIDAWKPLPPELHSVVETEREAELGAVAVDRLEVSNAEFHEFLTATGYRPLVAHRFLAHWNGAAPAPGTGDEPVAFVSLDDARAYARWRGARLPSTAEWQLAIQRGAGRRDPLVWNWTASEHTDGVTRFALLKGGGWFAAEGSDWYVDGGPQPPEWELKLVLPGGGLERSACVGFRCAVQVAG
ncbi:SUMF1/EgtB/PvdO family nonheme iron enzyme [Amycolatopsis nigrescens]|uniref:SUMF1/EgtB/PvdO family nonheme iron enzyme n=1 Tax=Amycolatopsis nigrescens TaxID=381445 RepID=UPI000373D839|nr:SUMF1/EgtB/PvdO family nonheme iron enzyme [Amycolatopsis nigrescens]